MYVYKIATLDDNNLEFHGEYKTPEEVASKIKYMETINPDSILIMIRSKADIDN